MRRSSPPVRRRPTSAATPRRSSRAILSVAGGGDTAHAGGNIQVVLDEVTEGDWGAGGKTISLASIADTVGLGKDGERFKWVNSYFEAKARQFAAAGYPTDTGGLFPKG